MGVGLSGISKMRFQFEAASKPHGTPASITLVAEANRASRLADARALRYAGKERHEGQQHHGINDNKHQRRGAVHSALELATWLLRQ